LLEEAGEVGVGVAFEFRKGGQQEHHAEIEPKQHQRAPREDALDDLSWKPHANAPPERKLGLALGGQAGAKVTQVTARVNR
jgi:hypothetical protein